MLIFVRQRSGETAESIPFSKCRGEMRELLISIKTDRANRREDHRQRRIRVYVCARLCVGDGEMRQREVLVSDDQHLGCIYLLGRFQPGSDWFEALLHLLTSL